MTRLAFKEELLDAQLRRVVSAAVYGGSDVGECLATARRIEEPDLGSWYAEWRKTADAAAELNDRRTARDGIAELTAACEELPVPAGQDTARRLDYAALRP